MPNLLAYTALAIWPAVPFLLFAAMQAHRALVWSIVSAYLVLPVGASFDFPGVPPIDKTTIPNLSVLIACALFCRREWLTVLGRPAIALLSGLFVLSPLVTSQFNGQPLIFGGRVLPGMTLYDGLAQSANNAIILVPFVLGYGLVKSERERSDALKIVMIAVLAYSALMLVEIRLSPQLHRWVYGYFPHSFLQQMRDGGFRPVVFLGHGLLVAILCAMGVLAAVGRWRTSQGRAKQRAALAATYLTAVLVLCKSFGALLLALAFAPAVAFLRARSIALLGSLVGLSILVYPVLRAANVLPINLVLEATQSLSEERASSFNVRIVNEEQLLKRASVKPITGWGSWGRSRVYSELTGDDTSITDGTWIIVFGSWGWLGYVSMFGLLGFGAIEILIRTRSASDISLASACLLIVLTINLLDSIPNSSIRPLTWLLSGIVLAAVQRSNFQREARIKKTYLARIKN